MGRIVIQKPAAFDINRLRKDLEQSRYVFGQPKLKGLHLRWFGDRLLLAGGKECTGLPHITRTLRERLPGLDLEGEAYWHGVEDEVVSGMARRSADNLHPDHEQVGFYIFDTADVTFDQKDRIKYLNSLALDFEPPLYLVDTMRVRAEDEVYHHLSWWLAMGYEGIILRHPLGLWKAGYSAALQKIKPGGKDTYKIVDAYRQGNALNGLLVEGAGGARFAVHAAPELDQPDLEGKYARVRYTQFVNGKPLASAAVEIVEAGEGEAAA